MASRSYQRRARVLHTPDVPEREGVVADPARADAPEDAGTKRTATAPVVIRASRQMIRGTAFTAVLSEIRDGLRNTDADSVVITIAGE